MTKNVSKKKPKRDKEREPEVLQLTGRTRIRLKSAKDVCRYISSCIRRSEREGAETTYYKRVMMSAMLIKALEVGDLEERLKKLEQTGSKK